MTDNEIVGERIKAKQETLAWRNAFKTRFEQDEPFTDLDLSAWLAIQDVLAMPKGIIMGYSVVDELKRLNPDLSVDELIRAAYRWGAISAQQSVIKAITNRIGGE